MTKSIPTPVVFSHNRNEGKDAMDRVDGKFVEGCERHRAAWWL